MDISRIGDEAGCKGAYDAAAALLEGDRKQDHRIGRMVLGFHAEAAEC